MMLQIIGEKCNKYHYDLVNFITTLTHHTNPNTPMNDPKILKLNPKTLSKDPKLNLNLNTDMTKQNFNLNQTPL